MISTEASQALALAYADSEDHPVVQAFLRQRWPSSENLCLDIAAGDEMFDYALGEQHQHRGLALLSYFRSGLTAYETLEQILEWRFRSIEQVRSLLDFASGYGRVTRFLVDRLAAERVTSGEISQGALDFQSAKLGTQSLLSSTEPSRLRLPLAYQVVVAFSLFTHLPDTLFREWLARLWSGVAQDGLLVFSVNDEAVLFPGRTMPKDGIYFEPVSENQDLAAHDYGSTWVREDFVRRSVATHCPGATICARIPRGLWHFQDLYVLARDKAPAEPLSAVLPPEGYLDTCTFKRSDELQVAGWAIDRQRPQHPPEITVRINGDLVARTEASEERQDLGEILGHEFSKSGWVVTCRPSSDAFCSRDLLMVEARSHGGRTTILHASALEGADLARRVSGALEETRAANLHLQAKNAELERQITTMKQSRFWKARNAWFRFKT